MANQAWQIKHPGSMTLENLGDVSKPDTKQALVRIHAAALNYRDKLVVDHDPNYPVKAKPNLVPGSDGAGVVEETGTDSKWKKGDRVVIHANEWTTGYDQRDYRLDRTTGGGEMDGTLRSWMVVDDSQLFPAPGSLSLEEASTLFTAGVTAYRALFYGGVEVKRGTTVLTQGTGGVSCFAIMIAAAAGATVIATSSSDEKLEIARKLGASHLINYRKIPNWSTEVLKATDGKGVDLVVDVVGAQSIEQTLKSTAFSGVVCVLGMLSEDSTQPVNIMNDILFGAKTLRGQLGAGSRPMAEELSDFMEKHKLHPPVAETFEFEKADQALKALITFNGVGKIVVRV